MKFPKAAIQTVFITTALGCTLAACTKTPPAIFAGSWRVDDSKKTLEILLKDEKNCEIHFFSGGFDSHGEACTYTADGNLMTLITSREHIKLEYVGESDTLRYAEMPSHTLRRISLK